MKLLRLFTAILLMGLAPAAWAQQVDTLPVEPVDTVQLHVGTDSIRVDTIVPPRPIPAWLRPREVNFTIGYDVHTQYVLDTTMDDKQYFDPAQANQVAYRNLGNLGQPLMPLTYVPRQEFGFYAGFDAYAPYKYTRYNLRWYDTRQPFTRLFLLIGTKREQMVSVVHNQTIGQRFNFTFRYTRISSPGSYVRQETNNNHLGLTTAYSTKGKHYKVTGIFLLNNMQTLNNGGVESTDIFQDTSFITSAVVNMNLANAQTDQKEQQLFLRQELNFGEKVQYQFNDSIQGLRLFPELQFFHEVGYTFSKYRYFDARPDSGFYAPWVSIGDSLEMAYSNRAWTNRFGVAFGKVLKADSLQATYRNFYAEANLEHQFHWLEQILQRHQVQNLNFEAQVRSHPQSQSKFVYQFKGRYALAGYNLNDVGFDLRGGYDMGKLGIFEVVGNYRREEAAWVVNHLSVSEFDTFFDFNKIAQYSGGISYRIAKIRFQASVLYHAIDNQVYYNTERLPEQADVAVNFWTVTLQQNFRIWDIGLDNLIRLYLPTDNGQLLRYPKYFGRHSLFYQKEIFKKNLRLRTGVDVYYNTNYQAYGYSPLLGQFYLQEQETLKFYPVIDFFLSMQIAELVVFMKLEHLNKGFQKQKGYFNAYGYPSIDRSFKVGVIWRFYN